MDDIAERVARRFEAIMGVPTANAKNWGERFEAALKAQGADMVGMRFVHAGNVRTKIQTLVNGKQIPEIEVAEKRVTNAHSRIEWVRIDSGPGAKFINDPSKMAKYVMQTYA